MARTDEPKSPSGAFIKELEDAAVASVKASGAFVIDKFRNGFEVFAKNGNIENDIVTDADRLSQAIIVETIAARFPDHSVIGEENDDAPRIATDVVWSVDPIDGTRNFACRAIEFGISVAALYRGNPVAGAIWTPWHEPPYYRIIHARLNGGAWSNGKRLRLNNDSAAPNRRHHSIVPPNFSYAYSLAPPMAERAGEIRIIGSVAWEATMLVHNTAQYIATAVCHHWDITAAAIIINEAGGVCLSAAANGELKPLRLWDGAAYENDFDTFAKMRDWRGNFVGVSPRMSKFLQDNLRLVKRD